MKRPEITDYLHIDLNPQSKKPRLSTSNPSAAKPLKLIPITDSYIAKLLSKNPDKFLNHFSNLSECLSVKQRLKIDQYSTAMELSMENPANDNLEFLNEQFSNILADLKKKLKETKIPCSLEEHNSLMKYIEKGRISIESDLLYINEFNSKPLILKEYVINEGFSLEIVLIEDFQAMSLDPSDNLVINFTKNGVFLDDFMQKQRISKKILQFFKKNQTSYFKDWIFEANLPEFKVFLQIFDSKELLNDELLTKMTRIYLKQLLGKILANKQYVKLYYPLPTGREKETMKIFLEEMIEISKNDNEDSDFLKFPSKMSFLCIEKQREIVLEIFEKFKTFGSLEDLPAEFSHGGRWSLMSHEFYNNWIPLTSRESRIIEKAFILGEKQGVLLIDEKIQELHHRKNYHIKNNDDEITVDLKRMIKTSKLIGYEIPVIFDEEKKEFQFLDEISGKFINYHPKFNQVLTFLQKIHHQKLIYHVDFETMKPREKLYSFDLTTFTLKDEETPLLPNQINANNKENINNNNLNGQIPKIFTLARTKDKKLDPFLKNSLKFIKPSILIKEAPSYNSFKIKRPSNKTPQLIIRSMENEASTIKAINELLLKKQITHFMKMKQNSKLLQKSLEDLCLRNNIQWYLNDKVLRIKGNRKTINKIRLEIQQLDEMDLEDTIFPENWDPQTENLKEIELSPQLSEFTNVSKAFNTTCPFYEVVKVTRIQNKKLWENYIFEKKRLQFKGNSTEKMLFHGTKQNDPRKIYSGIEEGFDVRLAHSGLVGKGIYFAEKASYSAAGYAYIKTNGNFTLIYANVLVGAISDSLGGSYVMPPLMPNDSTMRFDSVRSYSSNYTVYNSNRAYPAYVIEYVATKKNKGRKGALKQVNNVNLMMNIKGCGEDDDDNISSLGEDDDY